MKVSLNWLKRYIDFENSPEEIAEILTMIGLEVEGISKIETVKGGLQGVVVGEVVECAKHPNADKLSLTKVNIGDTSSLLQIICGAPNVAESQKVMVATIGSTIYPMDGEPMTIKKGKIRGEYSEGMICSESELHLSRDHSGILVLPNETKTGMAASEYFEVKEDYIIDIGLTPNRSDATSHIGIARDLVAYLQVNQEFPYDLKLPETSSFKIDMHTGKIKVVVENTTACPRYSGLMITDIEVKDSPNWLKSYLRSIDVRPINNIVDITNFILHETGQPLHAFDADKITSGTVVIKNLPEGTLFTTLDTIERKLSSEDLMICDGEEKGMCIAGVFGGLHSGVTEKTKTIFLESAYFDSKWIRKTSTRHNLRTDAARIFEKGANPSITVYALKRAAILIRDIANGVICSEIIDAYPKTIEKAEIHLKYENVRNLIGINITREEIHNVLRSLNMEIEAVDQESIMVHVPTDKADVTREVDLIEEILRIYGFNRVEVGDDIISKVHFSADIDRHILRNKISGVITDYGFSEMMGMSLIESKWITDLSLLDAQRLVFINNTSNTHLDTMRPEMMVSGIQSILYNHNRQNTRLKLFEIGRSYQQTNDQFEEKEHLTLFLSGDNMEESWKNQNKKKVDFYDMKQVVHDILRRVGIKSYQINEIKNDKRFQFGLKYSINEASIVHFGMIHPEIKEYFALKEDVYYAEFAMETLIKVKQSNLQVEEISKYPAMRRDLALVIEENIPYASLESLAWEHGSHLLKDINLFDVYQNEKQLGKGKKSYAISLLFKDDTKTLTDKDIDQVMTTLINAYEQNLSALVRK